MLNLGKSRYPTIQNARPISKATATRKEKPVTNYQVLSRSEKIVRDFIRYNEEEVLPKAMVKGHFTLYGMKILKGLLKLNAKQAAQKLGVKPRDYERAVKAHYTRTIIDRVRISFIGKHDKMIEIAYRSFLNCHHCGGNPTDTPVCIQDFQDVKKIITDTKKLNRKAATSCSGMTVVQGHLTSVGMIFLDIIVKKPVCEAAGILNIKERELSRIFKNHFKTCELDTISVKERISNQPYIDVAINAFSNCVNCGHSP